MMINLVRIKNFFKSTTTAYAHCDVPCGIYQPDDAVQAADRVYFRCLRTRRLY